MYEAKNSKICNFWIFWPVIQLINHNNRIIGLLFFAAFASYIASILKELIWLEEYKCNRYNH